MPWKIQRHLTQLTGPNPVLHMSDLSVDVHLVHELRTGILDLYIGGATPELSAIHIEVDVERKRPAKLMRGRVLDPNLYARQLKIIDNVLSTMNIPQNVRWAILAKAREVSPGWENRVSA